MEFRMINPQSENGFVQTIEFNFDELKTQISESLEKYNNLVYTEETIKEAKEDRAKLNKFKDAIETKRKEIKKLCLKPYDDFEVKIKELTGLIDKPILAIDTQVKTFEDEQKERKRSDIESFYLDNIGDLLELLPFDKIFNPKWLNSTVKFTAIEKEMLETIGKVNGDLKVIADLKLEPDMELIVRDKYLTTLDFSAAMQEKTRLQNVKNALEKRETTQEENILEVEEPTEVQLYTCETQQEVEPEREPQEETAQVYTRKFWVRGTKDQLISLADFLDKNGIEYGGIAD